MIYDIAIIGAGVIGSSIASQLSKYDIDIIVIEKENDVSCGASMANSGIVHAGYDAVPGTLKAKMNVEGAEEFENFAKRLHIPYKINGSLVVAFDKEDEKVLRELLKRGMDNGVSNISIVDKDEIRIMEPNLSDNITLGLYAKDAAIVSPWDVAIATMEHAMDNGCKIMYEEEVIEIKKDDTYILQIRNRKNKISKVSCKWIINCAGVYADKINDMVNKAYFKIIPRKGEYYLFDKEMGDIVTSTVFQCPSKKGKGVLLAPTVHGNVLAGPNANEIYSKEDNSTTKTGLEYVRESASRVSDKIEFGKVIRTFAGIRATEEKGDFIIEKLDGNNFINVAGIDSPGLSSVPAIMKYVEDIFIRNNETLHLKDNYKDTRRKPIRFFELSEKEKVDITRKDPTYGKIVCRCETVCEGEIVDAIKRNCGARDIKGIKKRTRAGAGRCQSGFCLPRVVEILKREMNISINDITYDGRGSEFLSEWE